MPQITYFLIYIYVCVYVYNLLVHSSQAEFCQMRLKYTF